MDDTTSVGGTTRPSGTAGASGAAELPGVTGSMSVDRCHRFGTYAECPMCGGTLRPEHAHFKCAGCGWRDSCCD